MKTNKVKINKIKILSLAKMQTIFLSLIGLIAGIVYSFGGLLIDTLVSLNWITSNETPGLSIGTILAFGALIGMPLLFGAFGLIIGIIEGILYNFASKWFKGIEIEFE